MYMGLKHLHMGLAYLTLLGFILRGIWMWMESPLLHKKLVRVLPHVIDTIFLAAGVALAVMIQQYPFVHAWVTAKVLGLIAYIVLGIFALRKGRTKLMRGLYFLLAIAVFMWVFSVAKTKNPMGFLAGMF